MRHNWPSYYYILPTVSFSILYNIPKFFELKTETRYFHQTFNETGEQNSTDLQVVTETYEVIIDIHLTPSSPNAWSAIYNIKVFFHLSI